MQALSINTSGRLQAQMLAKAGLSKACKKALLAMMIDEIHSQSTLFSKKFIALFQRHKFIVLFQCCKFFDISQGFATQKAEFRLNFHLKSSKIQPFSPKFLSISLIFSTTWAIIHSGVLAPALTPQCFLSANHSDFNSLFVSIK